MLHKHLTLDKQGRIFIFGDTHGEYALIEKAKLVLGITEEDTKVFLADTIDRGKQNLKCFLEAFRGKNAYTVMGNHEWMMVKGYIENNREWFQCWLSNGGLSTLDELGDSGCEWLAEVAQHAPCCLTLEANGFTYAFVHGGYPVELSHLNPMFLSDVNFSEEDKKYMEEVLVWDRATIKEIQDGHDVGRVRGVDYIFHGHSYVKEPIIHHNRVYMDTGSVFNGNLTVAILEEDGELWFYSTLEED